MSTIFESQPGRLISLPADTPRSFTLDFDGKVPLTGILVSLEWGGEVSAQITTSMQNTIHAVALGDRPVPLTVSVLLNETCETTGDEVLQGFLDFYQKNRFADRDYGGTVYPQTILIGRQSYQGFLIRHHNTASAQDTQQMVGQLTFLAWRF